ncbi:MAG: hypothetical protein AAGA56_23525, partial [Myxococcota bacterium]
SHNSWPSHDSYPKSDVFAAGFKGMPATPTTRILVMAAVPRDPKQAQQTRIGCAVLLYTTKS